MHGEEIMRILLGLLALTFAAASAAQDYPSLD
jgi:hypothetical protein